MIADAPVEGQSDRRAQRSGRPKPWRGTLVLVVALAWVFGVASMVALVLALVLRRSVTSQLDRSLLRAGMVVAVLGLAVMVLSYVFAAGATS